MVNTSLPSSNSNIKEHSELYVVLAEVAFYTENYALSRHVIESILQLDMQLDQFYCRAKLLLALLIQHETKDYNGTELLRWHKYAVAEVMLALDVVLSVKNAGRYKFMLFNVSVVFWRIVQPFLRQNRAKHFLVEMKRIVNALEGL